MLLYLVPESRLSIHRRCGLLNLLTALRILMSLARILKAALMVSM